MEKKRGCPYRQMYRKFKKVVLDLLAPVTPSVFFSRILRSEALVYNSYFFQNSRSTEIIRHQIIIQTRPVISNACLLVKMASKTVTRSIKATFSELIFIVYFNNLFTNLFCTRCLKERQKSESIVRGPNQLCQRFSFSLMCSFTQFRTKHSLNLGLYKRVDCRYCYTEAFKIARARKTCLRLF